MRVRWAGFVFLAFELLAQAQTRYVTDRTIVELRRGPSTEYLILRNLEAGRARRGARAERGRRDIRASESRIKARRAGY